MRERSEKWSVEPIEKEQLLKKAWNAIEIKYISIELHTYITERESAIESKLIKGEQQLCSHSSLNRNKMKQKIYKFPFEWISIEAKNS